MCYCSCFISYNYANNTVHFSDKNDFRERVNHWIKLFDKRMVDQYHLYRCMFYL